MADSTDDEEYEYDEQASVSEDYPDESGKMSSPRMSRRGG